MRRPWRPASYAQVTVYAAKAAIASGVSWFVAADVLGNHIPVFAPLAALLTMQVTVRESVSRGLQRVLGVMVGVLFAFGFARAAGIHAWTIALIIFASLLLGRALRLGPQGSIQVPVSALLVLAVGSTRGGYGSERIIDTALGAGIGIVVSLVALPSSSVKKAEDAVRALTADLAALLREMAAELSRGPSTDLHLATARRLSSDTGIAARRVADAQESIRWNPAGRRSRAMVDRLQVTMARLELVELQVRGIARTIADGAGRWTLPPAAAEPVAGMLGRVAERLQAAGTETGTETGGPGGPSYADTIAAVRAAQLPIEAAAGAIAIAVDARRILDELDERP